MWSNLYYNSILWNMLQTFVEQHWIHQVVHMVLCRGIPSQITLPLRFRDRCTDPPCWARFRVWNDLQTVKKEGQEKELQVTENNTTDKSKHLPLFAGHFSQFDCSGRHSARGKSFKVTVAQHCTSQVDAAQPHAGQGKVICKIHYTVVPIIHKITADTPESLLDLF